ncbi:CaiB/BaiF CoA transferase family protein [Arthrobacter sp. RAF14]|uniref:CaiB/BaiF CoA transferase family protein n=1 Tax=Arthrobacter sp. RAF14 TaxID=3233051 RepID=UPI003F90E659
MIHRDNSLGPLDGLLVVDLSRALAGPHATMMLGDLGARVIKIENPGNGDDTRGWGPPFVRQTGDGVELLPQATAGSESSYFLSANRNKESLTLNLKSPKDRQILLDLVDRADVLVENFRTGVLERLGLGLDSLLERNPALVALSITGFGHDGPEGGRAGYDQIAQGEAGLMSFTGPVGTPIKSGTPISDLLAGMYGAFGVLAALHEREKTGRGQVVRTSLLAATVGVHAFQGTRWTVAQVVPEPEGNHHVAIAPYGSFACADGLVQIAVGSEKLWQDFCNGFALDAAAPDFADNAARVAHREELIRHIEETFSTWDTEDLLKKLATLGIPAGRVRSLDQVYSWDQTLSQRLLIDVDHATLGTVQLPGAPLRFFAADGAEVTRTAHTAPPALNQHGESVRDWLAQGNGDA